MESLKNRTKMESDILFVWKFTNQALLWGFFAYKSNKNIFFDHLFFSVFYLWNFECVLTNKSKFHVHNPLQFLSSSNFFLCSILSYSILSLAFHFHFVFYLIHHHDHVISGNRDKWSLRNRFVRVGRLVTIFPIV
jgi:hypothetical protein